MGSLMLKKKNFFIRIFCFNWFNKFYKITRSDRASPSTREAIAGMLSFSTHCYSTKAKNCSKVSNLTSVKLECSNQKNENALLLENLEKVHQDEDFSKYLLRVH